MKKLLLYILLPSLLLLFTQCGGNEGGETQETDSTASESSEEESPEAKKYTLKEVNSPAFADSKLSINNLEEGAKLEPGKTSFEFSVENYELGVPTEDAEGKNMANSAKGQHIHVIIDNEPYSAHYEPKAEKEFSEGGHIMLAFLSRSYHESVKNENAYVLRTFTVGDSDPIGADLSAPHLFYSRPKGEYAFQDGEDLLLDFYLMNTTLSPEGNKVRATINGEEHIIDKWAPYAISGLERGEVSIKLELINQDGNVIPGPFNTVERSVNLVEPPVE